MNIAELDDCIARLCARSKTRSVARWCAQTIPNRGSHLDNECFYAVLTEIVEDVIKECFWFNDDENGAVEFYPALLLTNYSFVLESKVSLTASDL